MNKKTACFRVRLIINIIMWSLILGPLRTNARQLEQNEIRAAVETWVRYATADARPDAIVITMEPYIIEGKTYAFIAHLSGGGFCLCGADELVLPVYLYSPYRKYNSEIPDYQFVLWEIAARTKYLNDSSPESNMVRQTYNTTLSDRNTFWNSLASGIYKQKTEKNRTYKIQQQADRDNLDFTPMWHQGEPYNDLCPTLGGEHTVVGCTATAMSQIMYYWQWPWMGEGEEKVTYKFKWCEEWLGLLLETDPQIVDHEDYWRYYVGRLRHENDSLWINGYWDETLRDRALTLSDGPNYQDVLKNLYDNLNDKSVTYRANFNNAYYNWNEIENAHYSFMENEHVSQLCLHVGISIDMDYGIVGSGAPISDVPNALKEHFRYYPNAQSTSDIDGSKIIEEIMWSRPVMFSGFRKGLNDPFFTNTLKYWGKVGHTWVIYGYDRRNAPDIQFLMNLGWGEYAVDDITRRPLYHHWYSLDHVKPDTAYTAFSFNQAQATHIAPRSAFFVGSNTSGDGSPQSPYRNIEEAIANTPSGIAPKYIFKGGEQHSFSGKTLVLDKPCTLEGQHIILGNF